MHARAARYSRRPPFTCHQLDDLHRLVAHILPAMGNGSSLLLMTTVLVMAYISNNTRFGP
jgi:hypothetical protein